MVPSCCRRSSSEAPGSRYRSDACTVTTRCLIFSRKAIGSNPPTTAFDGSYWTPKCRESGIAVEQGEEGLLLLRELGVEPVADLVVVLEAQHDVPLDRVLEGSLDALGGAGHAFRDREARILLAAERAAVTGARADRQIDRPLLPFDLAGTLVAIGMGEVRREAHHRRDLPGRRHRVHHRCDVALVVAPEELIEVLDAFAAERGGVVNPLDIVPPAVDELVDVALREDRDRRARPSLLLPASVHRVGHA